MNKRSWLGGAKAVAVSTAIILGSAVSAPASSGDPISVEEPAIDSGSAGRALFKAIYFGVGTAVGDVSRRLNDNSYHHSRELE